MVYIYLQNIGRPVLFIAHRFKYFYSQNLNRYIFNYNYNSHYILLFGTVFCNIINRYIGIIVYMVFRYAYIFIFIYLYYIIYICSVISMTFLVLVYCCSIYVVVYVLSIGVQYIILLPIT